MSVTYRIICKIASWVVFVVPFLHNLLPRNYAFVLWILSLVVFLLFSVHTFIKNCDKEIAKPLDVFNNGSSIVLLVVSVSVFAVNYLDSVFDWQWAVAFIWAVVMPISIENCRKYCEIKDHFSKDQINTSKKNSIRFTVFYLLLDLFYVCFILDLLIGQFVVGVIVITVVFLNLAIVFVSKRVINKYALLHDFIFGVGITIYLIYIIPNHILQNVVLALVAALYGGFLSLVGVAWTIREGQRRELETKRLEKIPYLRAEFCDWKVSDDFGRAILPDLLLSINQIKQGEEVFLGTRIEITNIGLGMANNLSAFWISDINYEEHNIDTLILRGDESMLLSVIFDARYDASECVCSSALGFKFDDLLGNHYRQQLDIEFEIDSRTIRVVRFKMNAPEFIER